MKHLGDITKINGAEVEPVGQRERRIPDSSNETTL